MPSEHTPEPWEARQRARDGAYFIDHEEAGEDLTLAVFEEARGADVFRIVDCVNACAGIEDPGKAIREAREAFATLADAVGRSGWHTCSPTFRERKERTKKLNEARAALEGLGGIDEPAE
ncbi:MAG: hypothetical protein ACYTFG_16635 [Planctomycetota bacterium]|jgi:hypothetical protein